VVIAQDIPRGGLFRGPATYIPRTPWSAGWAALASLVIVVLSLFGAVLLIGGTAVMGMPGSGAPEGAIERGALLTMGVWQVLAILLTVLASFMFGGNASDVLALRQPSGNASVYVMAIVLLFLLQVGVSIVQYALITGDMFADLRPFVNIVGGQEWLLALLVIGIGAPLSEELLFRGFLLSALAKTRIGFLGAANISAALWTALHAGYSIQGIVEVFVIGLFFSWLLWRTGSLRVPIACHALYNSLIVVTLRHVPLPT
jgi:membrane protease YdiL (CAAX protease family)